MPKGTSTDGTMLRLGFRLFAWSSKKMCGLMATLLREFVEKIVVHECSYDENKTRRQDIEIYSSFVGKVDLPE